jgi:hypothetical protein
MLKALKEPDFGLDETLSSNLQARLNFTTEEIKGFNTDIDGIVPLV